MTETYDYAIVGSMPLAALLAGELARTHHKRVIWAGAFPNPLRPARGFDLSAGPLTRPDTWRLLRHSGPEMLKVLSSIGETKVFERVDPMFVAQTRSGAEVLAHMRHVAAGYGFAIERQPISDRYADACQFRDAQRVLRRPFAEALPAWLEVAGVEIFPQAGFAIRQGQSGFDVLPPDEEPLSCQNVVLADEAAILAHAGMEDVAAFFRRISLTALMFEPADPLINPVIHVVDTGLTIHQRGNGEIESVSPLPLEEAGHAVWVQGSRAGLLKLSGQAEFSGLRTRHGGACFGPLRSGGPIVVTGFGTTGVFQIPAIARALAGTGSPEEKAYFAKRTPPGRAGIPAAVEYIPGAEPEFQR